MRDSSSWGSEGGAREGHDRFYPPPLVRRALRAPIGFHITMRLTDDRPIATTPAALRVVARVMLEQGRSRGLLAFGAAADHLHAALATERATAGAFARYVETALVWRLALAARFERARIRPLRDQKHATNTVHYAHRQDSRHGFNLDPAREGTSLPDLLGLRVVDTSIIARVRAHLPHIRREELVAPFPAGAFDAVAARPALSLPAMPIDLALLPDAAAAALALPDLLGRTRDAHRARRAAVHAAGPHATSDDLARTLGICVRAVQTLRAMPPDLDLIRAIERQAQLRR